MEKLIFSTSDFGAPILKPNRKDVPGKYESNASKGAL
jgi:hypothetical protein